MILAIQKLFPFCICNVTLKYCWNIVMHLCMGIYIIRVYRAHVWLVLFCYNMLLTKTQNKRIILNPNYNCITCFVTESINLTYISCSCLTPEKKNKVYVLMTNLWILDWQIQYMPLICKTIVSQTNTICQLNSLIYLIFIQC